MLPVGSLLNDAIAGSGFIAASIAIGGFIGQVGPTLAREEDRSVRSATTIGGLVGLAVALGMTTILKLW
ncbi:MAG TPA: hypothetical protein VF255_02710 [Solirubrobacterales bacterium]